MRPWDQSPVLEGRKEGRKGKRKERRKEEYLFIVTKAKKGHRASQYRYHQNHVLKLKQVILYIIQVSRLKYAIPSYYIS
jgi:hypothetical protein